MTLSLVLSDNADSTGGVATISGSSGASNTVYYAPYAGDMGSFAWTVGGTLTGDGTISLALGKGFFIFQLVSNGTLGPWAKQNFTDGLEAAHKRILDAVAAREADTGVLASNKILVRWAPRPDDLALVNLPLIYICPIGNEGYSGSLNSSDDVFFPTAVCYIDRQNQDNLVNLPAVTLFRQKTSAAFIKQHLIGVQGVWDCDLLTDVTFDPALFFPKGVMSSVVPLSFKARRGRGLI